ncbi:MAG: peptidyl-prolyl cis-trans isomerase [Myxococcales bacterium]|nr:peptidyl-prolyl cis-trans isomerase [Myxococcales bacterium]
MTRTITLALALALTGLTGCGRDANKGADVNLAQGDLTPEEKGHVVARIGEQTITLEEFEARLGAQSPFARMRYDSPQRKREFLDGLVRFELIAAEAARQGFDRDPAVVLARKQALVTAFVEKWLAERVSAADVTDAEIEAWYQGHPEEYDRPAQVRIAHLRVADEARARALLTELQAAVAADPKTAREVFAEAVRRASDDEATRDQGGDLGFVGEPGVSRTETQATVPPPVAAAGFTLDAVGALAPAPIKSSQGWHLVQKTGFRRPYRRALDDVRGAIRNTLYRQKKTAAMEAFVAELRQQAKVEIDEAALAAAKQPPPGPTPGIAPPIAPPEAREAQGAPR